VCYHLLLTSSLASLENIQRPRCNRGIFSPHRKSNNIRHESDFEEEMTPSRHDAASGAHCPVPTLSYFRCWLLPVSSMEVGSLSWSLRKRTRARLNGYSGNWTKALVVVIPIPPSYDASAHRATCTMNSTRTCTSVRFCPFCPSLLWSVYIYRF